jgi:predicted transcriptional regulator
MYINMTPNKIKSMLVERGISISSIAKNLGVSQPTVSQTIKGTTVSFRVREAISNAIGKPIEKLWPQ